MDTDVAAQAGTLETEKDAGPGPQGIVARWCMELDLADKTEDSWRGRAKDVNNRYRDEEKNSSSYNHSYNTTQGGRYSADSRPTFAI